jgi:D-glycero-D-manno-heptose 1,7-bisphosphate phosphatase
MPYMFDLDGTLISSYMDTESRDIDDWHVLPGRAEAIQELKDEGHALAIITNQAGVAFGYATEEQVQAKIVQALAALGFDEDEIQFQSHAGGPDTPESVFHRISVHVCYGHPESRDPRYNGAEAERRKPSPAMLLEAIGESPFGTPPSGTPPSEYAVFVGDMESDEQAARAAGVRYLDANEFFVGR